MIKKYLLGLGITLLGLIGFSSAGRIQMVGIEGYPSIYDNNFQLTFLKGGGLLSSFLGQGKGVLALNDRAFFWWATNGQPYYYDNTYQGFFGQYWLCDELTGYDSYPINCISYPITGDYKATFKGFFSSVKVEDLVYYNYEGSNVGSQEYDNTIEVCWSSSEFGRSLCFRQHECSNRYGCASTNYGSLVNSQNLTDLTFNLISNSWIGYAPGQSNYDVGIDTSYGDGQSTVIPSNIDDYISYYENNFGFNETMCYVGIDDLDSVYGINGIEFEYGSGATIYGLYYHIYSGFGSNKIHNVGSFVNVWLLNYASWFETVSDERLYMAQYNGPDQNVTYIYSGFTFPFENKPVAIYFMADLLSEEYITESSQGENIVFYCDMKLNYNNYKNGSLNFNDTENLVDDKIKERAKDYINRNIKGSDGYSVPDLGSGSIWDGLVQSGYNIPTDLNPTNLFKDFYSKIDGLFKNFRGYSPNGIIPNWILFPMLFLILFRMLRH